MVQGELRGGVLDCGGRRRSRELCRTAESTMGKLYGSMEDAGGYESKAEWRSAHYAEEGGGRNAAAN